MTLSEEVKLDSEKLQTYDFIVRFARRISEYQKQLIELERDTPEINMILAESIALLGRAVAKFGIPG